MQQTIELAFLDYAIIIGFIALIIGIGLSFSRRAKNTGDFFLGGRQLSWVLAGTSMVATTFAADTPLAVTELVRQGGIAGNWLWWNLLAGGMLTTFFFARYWRRAGIMTDVELVSIRYSGKPARFLRGFKAIYMGIFVNALIIGWVNLALMSLLQVFFGMSSEDALMWTFVAMLIVFVYSGFSGLLGVVYTDIVQFTVAMTGSIILAVMVVNSDQIGGIDGLKAAIPEQAIRFFPNFNDDPVGVAGVLTVSLGSFLAFLVLPWWNSWYPGAEPGGGGYVVQRMMSAKDEKNALYANLYFQIAHYCIRPWPWILVALSCVVLYPDLAAADAKLGYVMAMKDFLPTGFKGLLLAAFFAAYMSTTASQLNWGSSYIINDLYQPFIKPNASDKQTLFVSRISILVMICVATGVTANINSISAVWNFLLQTGAGLGLVLILRWYWWRINAWSEIVGTIAPFIGYAIVQFILGADDPSWTLPIIENPKGFMFTLSFTIIAWLAVTLLTAPTEAKVLQAFYDRVKPAGNWGDYADPNLVQPNLKLLGVIWISAVIMAYSMLFVTGSIIFKLWSDVAIYAATFIVSLLVVRQLSGKVIVFGDNK